MIQAPGPQQWDGLAKGEGVPTSQNGRYSFAQEEEVPEDESWNRDFYEYLINDPN